MKVFEFGNEQSNLILIQMVDSHSIKMMDSEVELIRNLSGRDNFRLVACQVENWNRDLSPWEAPPVFGKEGFVGRAEENLRELRESVAERFNGDNRIILGGYSLTGLFALWAAYRMDFIEGIAAASPSVWLLGFLSTAESDQIWTKVV